MADQLNVIRNIVKRNGTQVQGSNLPLQNGDYLETEGSTSQAQVKSNGATAANVYGQNPTNVYVFPPSSLTRIYYNNSYRYQLTTPNGYIGIRG
jgi:hypothetical protein